MATALAVVAINFSSMILETFVATLKHDNGKARIQVVSLRGERGAIEQICKVQNCPERAIIELKKIKTKKIL